MIEEIHQKAEELQTMIDEMLEEMLVSIKEPGISLARSARKLIRLELAGMLLSTMAGQGAL